MAAAFNVVKAGFLVVIYGCTKFDAGCALNLELPSTLFQKVNQVGNPCI
jgi:hypothetical protein